MLRPLLASILLLALVGISPALAEDVLVYSAHREFDSRIYMIRENGSSSFHKLENYRIADMTVVDNDLYIADAFGPVVLRLDLETGELEQVINDVSLIYFYGLAYDGGHFYVKEWDLRRYDSKGRFAGRAPFPGKVFGMAWDGQYLWILDEANTVKAWDVSAWPAIEAVEGKSFTPPSPHCRGLWHDGESFWSAESVDGAGKIYRFDETGAVVGEFAEPAGRGWAAVVMKKLSR